jgi:hypothetical protein
MGFHRSYRFHSVDNRAQVDGTVWRDFGSKGPWLAIVDDTSIKVLSGGRDITAQEAQAPLSKASGHCRRSDTASRSTTSLSVWRAGAVLGG